MAIVRILLHLQMTLGMIITEEPILLYGVPALFALVLVIIVLRLILSRRRKRKTARQAAEIAVPAPATVEEVCEAEAPSEPTPVVACEPEADPLPEREPVPMPDIVGGEHAVVDMCPTDAVEHDGKLCLYFDLQVRID